MPHNIILKGKQNDSYLMVPENSSIRKPALFTEETAHAHAATLFLAFLQNKCVRR